MNKAKFSLLIVLLCSIGSLLHAMTFDNRFYPLIPKPFLTVPCRPSHFLISPFFMTASKAVGEVEDVIGIPELFGNFKLVQFTQALNALGLPNPIRPDLLQYEFPFETEGVLQAQGIELAYQQAFCDFFSIGFDWFFMRSISRQDFLIDPAKLNGASFSEIDEDRRLILQELGLVQANACQFGSSDFDLYLKFWHSWDFMLKFRRIDADFRLGVIFPTGVRTQLNSPASVPFGGNGHWGVYGAAAGEFCLKEDMIVGGLLRINKRFSRTSLQRLPIDGEPQPFGSIVGAAKVFPGLTLAFQPYVTLENLRAGLGVRLLYTLSKHWGDCWQDARCNKTVPLKFGDISQLTAWKSDYVSLQVFYDFGKTKMCRSIDPILIFTWDIPSLFFASERIATTHKISLGVEFNF